MVSVKGVTLRPCVEPPQIPGLLLDLFATHHKSGQMVDRAVEGSGIAAEDFAFVSMVGSREP